MAVAAICPIHGPFRSTTFQISHSLNTSIGGNLEPCPQCGAPSYSMEGEYDFDSEGRATTISAPQWSIDALEQVQGPIKELAEALAAPVANATIREVTDSVVSALRERDDELVQKIADRVAEMVPGKPRSQAREWLYRLLALIAGVLVNDVSTATYEPLTELLKFLAAKYP